MGKIKKSWSIFKGYLNQNMYNRNISFKVLFWKPSHICINDAIIENNLQPIKYYGILRRYVWSMPHCCNFMTNLCDAA